MAITTIFWDLGGVVLTNGWDREQRTRVLQELGITAPDEIEEFEDRHREASPLLEIGKCTLDDYLYMTAFGFSRDVSKEEFKKKMMEQSAVHHGMEVLQSVAAMSKYFLVTLNNESRELNQHRIETFQLRKYFSSFFSSCYLNMMKPNPKIFLTVLDIIQRSPAECLMIDDRWQNVESARRLGLQVIHYTDNASLIRDLRAAGVSI